MSFMIIKNITVFTIYNHLSLIIEIFRWRESIQKLVRFEWKSSVLSNFLQVDLVTPKAIIGNNSSDIQ